MAYNVDQPIQWLMTVVNDATATAVSGIAGKLISAVVAPLGAIFLGIYMILMTLSYLRGSESEPLMDFLMKMVGWAVIIGYGLNADNYVTYILPIVTGLGSDLAGLVGNNSGGYSGFDSLLSGVVTIIGEGVTAQDTSLLGTLSGDGLIGAALLFLKALILVVGVLPFVIVAVSFTLLANVGAQILGAVAPLFFFALMFPATRQYFSSWVNSVLSFALIPMLIAVVTLIATGVTAEILDLNGTGGTLGEVSLPRVFMAGLANWVFVFLLNQVASIASSLSAGGINAGMSSAGGGIAGIAKGITGSARAQARENKGVRDFNHARLASRREKQNSKNQIKGG